MLSRMVDEAMAGWDVREPAVLCGLPPSATHRLLTLVEAGGFVQKNDRSHRYSLGLEIHWLAWRVREHYSVKNVAKRFMSELRHACRETVLLALYDPARKQLMFVAIKESPDPLRHILPLNSGNRATPAPVDWKSLCFCHCANGRVLSGMATFVPSRTRRLRTPTCCVRKSRE